VPLVLGLVRDPLERLGDLALGIADLVLMDALMPGIDGFETCRRLKKMVPLAHLPVIFMTGLAETEHVVHGLAAGGVDYVTKPIVVEELLARMRVHLNNARVATGSNAALDAAGRFLLATDLAGRIKWCTPKARALLQAWTNADPAGEPELPDSALARMLGLRQEAGASCVLEVGEVQLECAMLSPIGPDELLFRLSEKRGGDDTLLLQQLGLTAREAEVLLWLSRGKANREIGQILGISPRTVNKHLEQVFVKLGVENRASAATRAVRLLTR
jgi:DNA-binding NarL/FixJ family response regulator